MPSHFSKLKSEVEKGILGKTQGIPMHLDRVSKFLSIRKQVYTLLGGNGGCLARGTGIIMFNGTIKFVEDIVPGDVLMGPDSIARTVIELKRGVQQMYWIRQNKGDDYRVNEDHILHLKKTVKKCISKKVIPGQLHLPKNKRRREHILAEEQTIEVVNITVKDVLRKSKSYLGCWKGYKVGVELTERKVDIEPYMLGIWLGNGSSSKSEITNVEPEILQYLTEYANKNGYKLTKNKITYNISRQEEIRRAIIGTIPGEAIKVEYKSLRDAVKDIGGAETNISAAIKNNILCRGYKWEYKGHIISLTEKLKNIGVLNNKHIPDDYKYNSRESRLQLLAGLIDTDGNRDVRSYEITQKNKRLADDIVYLSRSLGYYTSIREKTATMKRTNGSVYKCQVYRIIINGNKLCEIPCKVEKKKIKGVSTRVHDALTTGINIEKDSVDGYYGFILDKDNLFLLSDFTVTHNTGKTAIVDAMYVLEPYEWYLKNKSNTDIKIEWVYRSMERSVITKIGKWCCYKIWKDHGELIEPELLMGWRDQKLNDKQKQMFDSCEEYFTTMQDSHIVTILEGQENPRGIWLQLEEYALQRGENEKKSQYEEIYHPKDDNLIIVPVIDHAGKCRMETVDGQKTRKGTTDKLSEYMSIARDKYHMSPVVISQFNRSIKSEIFNKQADPEPTQESFKETGNLYDDCDVALTLFNPYKFKVYDHMGYEIQKFVDEKNGNNYFRSLKLIKSSYSADDIRWALGFNGAIGGWRTLPKVSEMDDSIIDGVKKLMYFIE